MIWKSQLRVISIKRLTQYPKASITMQKMETSARRLLRQESVSKKHVMVETCPVLTLWLLHKLQKPH